MIGWGIQTYAGIHDHPAGGCLAKVVRGPGLVETHYWKTNKNPFKEIDNSKDSNTKLYKCVQENDSDGCQLKNQTLAWITKLREYRMTNTNLPVMYQEGYDYMHSVFNPHNHGTLSLHHYCGDYHISFWEEF